MFSRLASNKGFQSAVKWGMRHGLVDQRGLTKKGMIGVGSIGIGAGYFAGRGVRSFMGWDMPGPAGSPEFNDKLRTHLQNKGYIK